MGEVAAMSTEQRAGDDDVVPGVAGGGFDAVLASSMLHSARIPAKTAARVAGAILRTPGQAAAGSAAACYGSWPSASAATRTTSRNWTAGSPTPPGTATPCCAGWR